MNINTDKLLNPFRNKLLNVIQDSHFDISLFEVSEEDGEYIIQVKETQMYFTVRQYIENPADMLNINEANVLDCKYINFHNEYSETGWNPSDGYENIDFICLELAKWLDNHVDNYFKLMEITKEIANTPDLWLELQTVQPFVYSKSFTDSDFELFTENEKGHIRDALSEFQAAIIEEISPMKEDLDLIKERMDYLASAVERLNRFDWKGVALSTVIGVVTNLSVDTNTGNAIVELFKQAFSAIKLLPG